MFKVFENKNCMWFVQGKGFVADCKWNGTWLSEAEVNVLRRGRENETGFEDAYHGDCGCDKCEFDPYEEQDRGWNPGFKGLAR